MPVSFTLVLIKTKEKKIEKDADKSEGLPLPELPESFTY